MKKNVWILMIFLAVLALASCQQQPKHEVPGASEIHGWNMALDEAIIHDGFSPPVAARIYAYSNLTYYYLLLDAKERAEILPAKLAGIPPADSPDDFQVRTLRAGIGFYLIARQLVYNDTELDNYHEKWKREWIRIGWNEEKIAAEVAATKEFTTPMITWMNADGYPLTRSMPRYTLSDEEGQWRPTPQDYMEALEPHWSKIRLFLMDSCMQFRPQGPYAYNLDPKSDFMGQFDSLLQTTRNLTDEQVQIARHWDDNSLVPIHDGHATTVEKKLTPGGHWMNICRGLARENKLSLKETAQIYCQMTLGMHDSFIAVWEAKYHFHSIRPVTVVLDNNMATDWKPLLVTPSFPEYPSGHSAVSSTCATILAEQFGTITAFIDSSEVPYGYPPRHFNSLAEAAQEVSDSRFYGGIHFLKALDDGMATGREVARFHLHQWPEKRNSE